MTDPLRDQLAAALTDEVLAKSRRLTVDVLHIGVGDVVHGLPAMRAVLLDAILPLVAQREQQLQRQIETLEAQQATSVVNVARVKSEGMRVYADECARLAQERADLLAWIDEQISEQEAIAARTTLIGILDKAHFKREAYQAVRDRLTATPEPPMIQTCIDQQRILNAWQSERADALHLIDKLLNNKEGE